MSKKSFYIFCLFFYILISFSNCRCAPRVRIDARTRQDRIAQIRKTKPNPNIEAVEKGIVEEREKIEQADKAIKKTRLLI